MFRNKLLGYGYIRKCFNKKEFRNLQMPPYYLIELINERISNIKWVHLISCGEHWTITVNEIINNTLFDDNEVIDLT